MSTKDPQTQARKFLGQLRVLEAERVALYEEILDPNSQALQEAFVRLSRDHGAEVGARRKAEAALRDVTLKALDAGVELERMSAPQTRNKLRDTIFQARRKLKKATALVGTPPPGWSRPEAAAWEYVDEALGLLDTIRGEGDT